MRSTVHHCRMQALSVSLDCRHVKKLLKKSWLFLNRPNESNNVLHLDKCYQNHVNKFNGESVM